MWKCVCVVCVCIYSTNITKKNKVYVDLVGGKKTGAEKGVVKD